ncbi:nitric oxide synthase oxygenase [Macrococcus equipercicus]|uniref:Nitric oxide synthase oxygenase n=1 Tax=Macrococcus equipercicus TaxID=69967 RepID=A0A9Q9BUY7_9STAP|nr:nitric oxide synthase oxygenase [Macrococcus equipercicus]UTH13433.1 nitric oxide synthase oxygenase [Macrococcus equipercicus]
MYAEAVEFIELMHRELNIPYTITAERLHSIESEIKATGTYHHTFEELDYGAKVAWRNSNRCIGRLFWDKLHVLDKRHLTAEAELLDAVVHHIDYATNSGKIRPTITIFPQGKAADAPFVIVNDQLVRYADDPIAGPLKQQVEQMTDSRSHILPLLYRYDGELKTFEIPADVIMEVPLVHPAYPAFSKLNLTWYAVPMISAMDLRIGGITYSCAPFNGWYMESEIASRNLLDTYRYDLLEQIADAFQLDRSTTVTYWRDKALVELNYAVYHSFKTAGVSIVDHYTASRQFEKFEQNELAEGRKVTGDWTWLIPPISPSLVHNFHKGYDNTYNNPNFYYRSKKSCPFLQQLEQ